MAATRNRTPLGFFNWLGHFSVMILMTSIPSIAVGAPEDADNIQFSTVHIRNQKSPNVTNKFLVYHGVPAFWSVLVGNDNFSNAVWRPYDGQFHYKLGPTNGEYEVWFGLKGGSPNAEGEWIGTSTELHCLPPPVVITNPTNTVVSRRILQIKGYSSGYLATVKFGISSDTNVTPDQLGLPGGRAFDSDRTDFQCYDLPLASGSNHVVVQVIDKAGNKTQTNFCVIFDPQQATNPPAIQIEFPKDGTETSAKFTCDGRLDDPTAKISAMVFKAGEGTNVMEGVVERDGKFWVENLNLYPGTNQLRVTASNDKGVTSVTNISVVRTDLVITLDPVTGDQWNPEVRVSGFISDARYSVWVNGVKAKVKSDGHWSADRVPTTPGSTASYLVKAYAPGEVQPDGSKQ